ncbi:MAG TPA: sensor histidine kinase [bacterium]|nr:sensor histidine kinase [bacterium]
MRTPAVVDGQRAPRPADAPGPWRRLRDGLFRLAVHTTSAHLARHAGAIVARWRASLRDAVPRYRDAAETSAWGVEELRVLLAVARAWTTEEQAEAREAVFRTARAVASEQLRGEFSLGEIQQALALFRLAVLGEIQRMLRRRLWLAFPWDVMRVADRLNEAIDLELLAIGQAYLDERAEVIREREQELVAGNEQLRTLLQEMHHRIKNNLQTLADLLYLEGHDAGSAEVRDHLRDSLARVKSIATVHRLLSLDHIGEADARRLAEAIAATVCGDLGTPRTQVEVRVDGAPVLLPSKQATSLALVLGELITNAMEHAFAGRPRGAIVVTLDEHDGEVGLVVRDDGVGLPDGLDPQRVDSLGLSIVRTLVSRDLGGRLRMWVDGGTVAEVTFRR